VRPGPKFRSVRNYRRGSKLKEIVAAGNRATAEAAAEILEANGNAFDAAVAAVFAAMMAEPTLTSVGGGGFLMAAPADSEPVLFDFFVDMPCRCGPPESLDFLPVDVDFGTAAQRFHVGRGAAAVPGMVPGLLLAHRRMGRLPLTRVLAPAVRIGGEGVELSPDQAYLIAILTPILLREAAGRRLFAPAGRPLRSGELFRNDALAAFLEEMGRARDPEGFYREEIGSRLASWSDRGGAVTSEDLDAYRAVIRRPLQGRLLGRDVFLNPLPAQGGWLIELTLALLDRILADTGRLDPAGLAMALHVTNLARRDRPFPEPGELPVSVTPRFSRLLELLGAGGRGERSPATDDNRTLGSTTHVSVLDRDGNAAAATTTNGEGCGCFVEGCGFMLNNMLGEEDVNPNGFFRHPPGRRLASMMAPTVVREGKRIVLATGSAGSNRIRSAIVQVMAHHLAGGMDLRTATDAPRIHVEGNRIEAEPGVSEALLGRLGERFEIRRWSERNLFFGGVNSASPAEGAADPRRGGFVVAR
jgi:gamma-glutamyltranspeptidase / glutathione hydrolase